MVNITVESVYDYKITSDLRIAEDTVLRNDWHANVLINN